MKLICVVCLLFGSQTFSQGFLLSKDTVMEYCTSPKTSVMDSISIVNTFPEAHNITGATIRNVGNDTIQDIKIILSFFNRSTITIYGQINQYDEWQFEADILFDDAIGPSDTLKISSFTIDNMNNPTTEYCFLDSGEMTRHLYDSLYYDVNVEVLLLTDVDTISFVIKGDYPKDMMTGIQNKRSNEDVVFSPERGYLVNGKYNAELMIRSKTLRRVWK